MCIRDSPDLPCRKFKTKNAPAAKPPGHQEGKSAFCLQIELHQTENRQDVDLKRLLELRLACALIGPMHETGPLGQDQAMGLGAKGDGAFELTRIGAATHGKRGGVFTRHFVIRIDKRLDRRAIRGDLEGLDRMVNIPRRAKALCHRAAGILKLGQVHAVG